MADNKPEPGAGDVEIILTGEKMKLVPSYEACVQISKMANNSLRIAEDRVAKLDLEFITDVVALGLDATSPALKKQVGQRIYETGVIRVATTVFLFIATVMNGGRVPENDTLQLAIDHINGLAGLLPQEMRDFIPDIEKLRDGFVAHFAGEGDGEVPDPLAESQSQSESSTDA